MKKYSYFVSFAHVTGRRWGFSWRVVEFNFKPTLSQLDEAVINHNKEFDKISLINFKLLDGNELVKE